MADARSDPDFPDWFSAVFVRELRQQLRANHFTGIFLTTHLIALVTVGFEVWLGTLFRDVGGFSFGDGSLLYFPLFFIFFFLLPRSQFSALQPEIGIDRNIELLAVSNIPRWRILRDKLLCGLASSLLLLVSLIPYFLLRSIAGYGGLGSTLESIFSLLGLNILMTAIFLGASGFRSYLVRIFVILFFLIQFLISLGLLGVGVPSGSSPSLLGEIGFLLCGTLFVTLALQLGRSRIKICSNPLEPPSSALILLLVFCTPILIGMGSSFLSQLGSWTTCLLLILVLILIDRDKAKIPAADSGS